MNEYVLGGTRYSFSYRDAKEQYAKYVRMRDDTFMANLPHVLHFAVFVCWFKQEPASAVLADNGLIHELAHLMCIENYGFEEDTRQLREIRRLFEQTCKLA